MTARERLIELMHKQFIELHKDGDWNFVEMLGGVAEYLLASGVIVPPCKVGDTVYFTHRMEHRITEHRVDNLYIGKKDISIRMSGLVHPAKPHEFERIFFTSRKEAEAALEEQRK